MLVVESGWAYLDLYVCLVFGWGSRGCLEMEKKNCEMDVRKIKRGGGVEVGWVGVLVRILRSLN